MPVSLAKGPKVAWTGVPGRGNEKRDLHEDRRDQKLQRDLVHQESPERQKPGRSRPSADHRPPGCLARQVRGSVGSPRPLGILEVESQAVHMQRPPPHDPSPCSPWKHLKCPKSSNFSPH